jgi:hypothetical protein
VDGRWTDGSSDRSFDRSPSNGRLHVQSSSRGTDNGANVNYQRSSFRNIGSTSPVLSTDTAVNHHNTSYGVAAVAVFAIRLVDRFLNLILSVLGNIFQSNRNTSQHPREYFESSSESLQQQQHDFLQDLADEAGAIQSPAQNLFEELALAIDEHSSSSREVFEEMAQTRSYPYPPTKEVFETGLEMNSRDGHSILTDMILEDLASAASFDHSVKSRPPSLYSVASIYRSTLDDLADASEVALTAAAHPPSTQKLTFFEEIARSIPRESRRAESNFSKSPFKNTAPRAVNTKPPLRTAEQRSNGDLIHPIKPGDSASQCGNSENGKRSIVFSASEDGLDYSQHHTDNGETTDAAKMLFMFGASSYSPQRYNANTSGRASLSPSKKYFLPGL